MNNMNYVFDVDGTLTPSRMKMDPVFQKFFLEFADRNKCYLVTGSDYEKTVQQVGKEICETVITVWNCCGNSVWQRGVEVYRDSWRLPDHMRKWLEKKIKTSKFSLRTGAHIEDRPGLVNFTVLGRNCTLGERMLYRQWDEENNERKTIAREFNIAFNHEGVVAQVAGETGLDIMMIGSDKSQVAMSLFGPTMFFGDKMEVGGNDYPLAQELKQRDDNVCIAVKDWKDTQKYLFGLSYEGLQERVNIV